MLNPSPTLSNVIVAVVSSFSAVNPAAPSCPERAIVKQPACAAASNSSGLVPTPFSNRVLKEYCVCLRTPLSVEMAPLPVFRSPCHTALALRCMIFLLDTLNLLNDLKCRQFDSFTLPKGIWLSKRILNGQSCRETRVAYGDLPT